MLSPFANALPKGSLDKGKEESNKKVNFYRYTFLQRLHFLFGKTLSFFFAISQGYLL
jgi:hypothetical protein